MSKSAPADFDSALAVCKPTPSGGEIKFGVGALTFEGGHQAPAIAIQVNDEHGTLVTQFALRMGSFEALLEGMKEVFELCAQGSDHDPQ